MVKKEETKTKKEVKETKAPKKPAKRIVKKPAKKKEEVKEKIITKKEASEDLNNESYFQAIGRRKTSVARVRLFTKGNKEFIINDKSFEEYFPTLELRESCIAPLKKMKCNDIFKITVKVQGGGINSQMEAVRHGISRALVTFNPDFKKRLRRAGYLTRDPRQRERKKPGLKRARRAPQWKKR